MNLDNWFVMSNSLLGINFEVFVILMVFIIILIISQKIRERKKLKETK